MDSCVLDALSYGLLALTCRLGDQSDSMVVKQIGFFQLPHSELTCITQLLALLYGSLLSRPIAQQQSLPVHRCIVYHSKTTLSTTAEPVNSLRFIGFTLLDLVNILRSFLKAHASCLHKVLHFVYKPVL